MGLKIEHIDDDGARGTLDGCLPVIVTKNDEHVQVRIADWMKEISCDVMTGAALMRYAVYAAIAAFRDDQRTPGII